MDSIERAVALIHMRKALAPMVNDVIEALETSRPQRSQFKAGANNDILYHLARLKWRGYDWSVPWEVIESLASSEGCMLTSYRCSAGVWTIGWGETMNRTVKPGMTWTEDKVDGQFHFTLEAYLVKVRGLVRGDATPMEVGALGHFAYNIGLGFEQDTKGKRGFYWSGVRKLFNEGKTIEAAQYMLLFDKIRDPATQQLVFNKPLKARRMREGALLLKPMPDVYVEPMPQAVEPTSTLSQSPIMKGSAVTTAISATGAASAILPGITENAAQAGAAMTTLQSVVANFKELNHTVAEMIGIQPMTVLLLAAVGFSCWAMYWRWKQRQGGFA